MLIIRFGVTHLLKTHETLGQGQSGQLDNPGYRGFPTSPLVNSVNRIKFLGCELTTMCTFL